MDINELRLDIAKRGKKGIHFIIASVIIWSAISIIWALPIKNILLKNLLTFCTIAPLMPLAYMISKIIKSDFSIKDNPLKNLGLLFSTNQFLYILIAIWAYNAVPDKMVMIMAVIFGAHLLPFAWLYDSKAYLIMAIVISITTLIVGVIFSPVVVGLVMVIFEVIFTVWLRIECKSVE